MKDLDRRHHVVVLLRLDKVAAREAADTSNVDRALLSNDVSVLKHDDDPDGYWRDIVSSARKYESGDYVGARDELDTTVRRLRDADPCRRRFLVYFRNVVALRNGDPVSLSTVVDEARSESERLLAVVVKATSLTRSGHRRDAIPLFEQAMEFLGHLHYPRCLLHTVNNLATSLRSVGRIEEARDLLLRHQSIVDAVATDSERASWHGALGACYRELEEYDAARRELELAIAGHELAGNLLGAAVAHSNLGNVLLHLGDSDGALQAYIRSADIDVQRGNPQSASTALSNAAIVYHNKGEYASALKVLFEARTYQEKANVHDDRAYTDLMLARTYVALGYADRARQLYRDSIDSARRTNDLLTEVQAVYSLADEILVDQPEEALELINQILPLRTRSELSIVMTGVTIVYSQILLRLNRADEARSILTEIRGRYTSGERNYDTTDLRNLHHAVAQIHIHDRLWADAVDELVSALTLARQSGNSGQIQSLLSKLATVYSELGNWKLAYECRSESTDLERSTRGIEAVQQAAVLQMEHEMELERVRSEQVRSIVQALLPTDVIEAWLHGERRVVDRYENVGIIFIDLAGFSSWSLDKDPIDVVDVVGSFFILVDQALQRHGCLKVKTIGDAVLGVAGAPSTCTDAANRCVQVGIDVLNSCVQERHKIAHLVPRIGLHVGTVIGGIVGGEKPQWDVWGSDVNLAARMESSGEPGRLHVSERVITSLTQRDEFTVIHRGTITVKGAGEVSTYWIDPSVPRAEP